MDNKGQKMGGFGIFIGIVLIVVVLQLGGVNIVGTIFGTAKEPVVEDAKPGAEEFCAEPGSITMTVGPMEKRWAPTTSVSAEAARVFLSGVQQGLKVDSETMTVRWKEPVDIYYAENSTTYYASKASFLVPCGAFRTASFDSDAHKLIAQDTTMTINVFNSDTGNLNVAGGTDNETIGTGETGKFEIKLQGTSKTGWAPYGYTTLVIAVNKTDMDEGQITLSGWESATVPAYHQYNWTDQTAVAFKKAFGISEVGVVDSTVLQVKAEDSYNPSGKETGDRIWLTYYFDDYYRNTVTGVEEFGVVTNLNALTSPSAYYAVKEIKIT